VSDRVAEPFWSSAGGPVLRHGPTYAGHATVCAPALANIGLLERDGLLEKGRENERADRKSTRLNSSHLVTSYAAFCLKKKNKNEQGFTRNAEPELVSLRLLPKKIKSPYTNRTNSSAHLTRARSSPYPIRFKRLRRRSP